jgi:hypothetical protein
MTKSCCHPEPRRRRGTSQSHEKLRKTAFANHVDPRDERGAAGLGEFRPRVRSLAVCAARDDIALVRDLHTSRFVFFSNRMSLICISLSTALHMS